MHFARSTCVDYDVRLSSTGCLLGRPIGAGHRGHFSITESLLSFHFGETVPGCSVPELVVCDNCAPAWAESKGGVVSRIIKETDHEMVIRMTRDGSSAGMLSGNDAPPLLDRIQCF
jgi:hypothetical protein